MQLRSLYELPAINREFLPSVALPLLLSPKGYHHGLTKHLHAQKGRLFTSVEITAAATAAPSVD